MRGLRIASSSRRYGPPQHASGCGSPSPSRDAHESRCHTSASAAFLGGRARWRGNACARLTGATPLGPAGRPVLAVVHAGALMLSARASECSYAWGAERTLLNTMVLPRCLGGNTPEALGRPMLEVRARDSRPTNRPARSTRVFSGEAVHMRTSAGRWTAGRHRERRSSPSRIRRLGDEGWVQAVLRGTDDHREVTHSARELRESERECAR
jgi:hypothetical protein